MITFFGNKLLTLTAGLDVSYPLLWLIPLLKELIYIKAYEG